MSYKQKKITLKNEFLRDFFFVCDPCRIQTCNPHIRSVVLYSVELTDHCFSKASAKVLLFFDMTKYFGKKMQNNLKLLLFVVPNEQKRTISAVCRGKEGYVLSRQSLVHSQEQISLEWICQCT